jgi:hypothetical protein
MPFQDPQPAVLKPIFVDIYWKIGPFRMHLSRLRRQIARDAFLDDLRRRLKRSHLTVAVDGGWISVTSTVVGGEYVDVPRSIEVQYRDVLYIPGPRLIPRRVS